MKKITKILLLSATIITAMCLVCGCGKKDEATENEEDEVEELEYSSAWEATDKIVSEEAAKNGEDQELSEDEAAEDGEGDYYWETTPEGETYKVYSSTVPESDPIDPSTLPEQMVKEVEYAMSQTTVDPPVATLSFKIVLDGTTYTVDSDLPEGTTFRDWLNEGYWFAFLENEVPGIGFSFDQKVAGDIYMRINDKKFYVEEKYWGDDATPITDGCIVHTSPVE